MNRFWSLIVCLLILSGALSASAADGGSGTPGTPDPCSVIQGRLTECENALKETSDGFAQCKSEYEKLYEECKGVKIKYDDLFGGKKKTTPPKGPPKKPVPKCKDVPVVEGDGAVSVVGHHRRECVVTYSDFSVFVKETDRRFDEVCGIDSIPLTDDEIATLRERDPDLLARIQDQNAKYKQCQVTHGHLVWLLAFAERAKKWHADQVTFNNQVNMRVNQLTEDLTTLEAALYGICQPREGQDLVEACKEFGDWVRSAIKDLQNQIAVINVKLAELDARFLKIEEDVAKLKAKRTSVQLLATGGYAFRPGDGPETATVTLRANLIHLFTPEWGVLLGGEMGVGFSTKTLGYGGARVNAYTLLNGDDEEANTKFALRFGPAATAGAPFENYIDEWNLVGEVGFQVIPGNFLLDISVFAGGNRAAIYGSTVGVEPVDGRDPRKVSDFGFVGGIALGIGWQGGI